MQEPVEAKKKEMDNALILATSRNDINMVKGLLANGAKCTGSALFNAVYSNNSAMVALLVKNIPSEQVLDVLGYEKNGVKTIDHAARQGYLACLSVICKAHKGLQKPLYDYALQQAVSYNDLKLVRQLLQAGANPNYANADGDTTLHLAIYYNRSPNLLPLLTFYGADFSKKNKQGKSALAYATESGADVTTLLANDGKNYEPWHTKTTFKTVANLFDDSNQRLRSFFGRLSAYLFRSEAMESKLYEKNTARRDAFLAASKENSGKSYNAIAGKILYEEIRVKEESSSRNSRGIVRYEFECGSLTVAKNIYALAREGKAKELVIKHIKQLNVDDRRVALKDALHNKDSNVLKFFAVARGCDYTRSNSGSFAKLLALEDELPPVSDITPI